MHDPLTLLREFGELERKRCADGVTPLEYLRWLDLDARLAETYRSGEGSEKAERRVHRRHETRMRVDFTTPDAFREARIRDLSRGGVFIATPFAAEVGTELVLRLHLSSTGAVYEVPGVVATNNVDGDFSTRRLGMGIHFRPVCQEQRLALDELLALVGDDGD